VARGSLNVLFVRPGSSAALSPVLRFTPALDGPEVLPVGLLRLASVVKYGTPHRVVVHDTAPEEVWAGRGEQAAIAARLGGGTAGALRERSGLPAALRAATSTFGPDLAVLWLHPAALVDGLAAARAVRDAGCPLVLGAGPLPAGWPEAARRLPELDGLLPGGGAAAAAALLAALDAIVAAAGGAGPIPGRGGERLGLAARLAAALALPDRAMAGAAAFLEIPAIDRKLLDYAVYRRAPGPPWPPREAPGRVGSDKGRFAVTAVPLAGWPTDSPGAASDFCAPGTVLSEVRACALLGIPWVDLETGSSGGHAPPQAWVESLLVALRGDTDRGAPPPRRRLRLDPAAARALAHDLRPAGIVAVDLGEVPAGDGAALREALEAAEELRRVRIDPCGTILLGAPGYREKDEEAGLARAMAASFPTDAGIPVRPGSLDDPAWSAWLDAPRADFVPPGIDDATVARALRARGVLRRAGVLGGPGGAGTGRRGRWAGLWRGRSRGGTQ
jgi:hypothetical protein